MIEGIDYSKADLGPCIEGTGAKAKHGYRVKRHGKKIWREHRLAFMLAHGAIPPGMQVCHKCDNRGCINVDHLFLGTAADNMQDAIQKGRSYKGKLRHAERQALIADYDAGMKLTELAEKYGITPQAVRKTLIARTNYIQTNPRLTDEQITTIDALARQGEATERIAALAQVSSKSVLEYCRDHGIKRPQIGRPKKYRSWAANPNQARLF